MQLGKKKFILLPTFIVLLSMLVAACGGGSSGTNGSNGGGGSAAPASQQVMKYPIGATDFSSLDPALVQLVTDNQAVQTIFTGLVQLNDQGQLIDQLAASHTVSSDGLTYTFTLKPNLKFSDGTPLTSADVAYSINRTLLPATKSQVAYYDSLIKDYDKVTTGKIPTVIGDSILTPDANTVKIIISKPAAYFLQALTYVCNFVVEKKVVDQYGTSWTDHLGDNGGQGGAGPFKVQSYSHSTGLTVVPNSNYYGKAPKLQKIEFNQSGDTNTTYNAYLSNQFDWASVPTAELAQAKARTQKDEHDYGILVIRYLSMNYLVKPFDNIHIRQAFALAIDKDLIATNVLRGSVMASNHIVPQGMVGYNSSLTGPAGVSATTGDANMAKSLLAQGLKEEGLTALPTITFSYYTDNTAIPLVAQALIQEWKTVLGATIKPQAVLFDKLIQLENATVGNGSLQMWIGGWQADYPDPQDWLSTFFEKGADYNDSNYGLNPALASEQGAVQQQLLQADVNQNQSSRLSAYNMAEQSIINDVGWIPLYQSEGHAVLNPKLVGNPFVNALEIEAPDNWANIYVAS